MIFIKELPTKKKKKKNEALPQIGNHCIYSTPRN